ncbi:MAG: hypothetical protein R3B40_13450 [Polyangiales bacterium]|nr:hypothetical protein [Myxococcales bacterium]MCB9659888.1 hypothetical protein [Sandaracinaceae bacterium]
MALTLGDAVDARVPWVRVLHDLEEARALTSPGAQLRALRYAGEALGDALRTGPRVGAVRTLPLTTLLYPTGYAFQHAVPLPLPYVVMSHRCLLVQVDVQEAGRTVRKNILFNPTDYEASKATPYFAQLLARTGDGLAQAITTRGDALEVQLARHGLSPTDIDLVAFDHFHTQDLRPILGCEIPSVTGELLRARFPNAYLLAPRREWDDWDELHPMQRSWFIAEGKRGVPTDRVVLFDADVALGDGCVLLRTPGHTTGNQTLFCHGERGVFGCSENGTSADSWSPYESRIPGLRAYSRRYDVEVVLNSNTPELAAVQYNSMVLERSVVDRVPEAPAFVQMFPSSEVTPSLLAPGVLPSMIFGERDSGTVTRAITP